MPRPWRLAESLDQLRDEVNAQFPSRSRISDGTIGDAAHASRSSDHNPWVSDGKGYGVVTAIDLTDDPDSGFDANKLVDWLVKVSHDKRIKYIIHDRKIYSSYGTTTAPAWAARPYSGPNPHTKHVHISVESSPGKFDDRSSWGVKKAFAPPEPPKPPQQTSWPKFPLPKGYYFGPRFPLSNTKSVSGYFSHAEDLKRWQRRMKERGWDIRITGRYDDSKTADVARAFQREKGLDVDGLVGADTWKAAWTTPIR